MINLEPLINKHFQKTAFIAKLIKHVSSENIYPTITVSRDPGSGGKAIAHEVAKQLKVKCFDDELIDMVAKQAKSSRKLVEALDEKTQSSIESIVNGFLGFESLAENTFMKSFTTVVLSIAAHQPAVVLGRGMNFVLPPATNFRVRVTAPKKVLVKYAMQYEGHSVKKARMIIDKYMKLRREFVRKYFSKDLTKSHYYDLVINTEYLTIEDAASIVISGFKQKFGL
jgi:cytidylate kinase